jgi:hypothetical protein
LQITAASLIITRLFAREALLHEPFRFISDKLGDGDAAIAKFKGVA